MCFGVIYFSRDFNLKKPCLFPDASKGIFFAKLFYEEVDVPTTEARLTTVLVNSSAGMTAVAMIHLDVLDADGQDVQGNVFVNEGSDSTLFREGFIRRSRQVG